MYNTVDDYKELYDSLLDFPSYLNVMIPQIETGENRDFKCCCPLHDENTPSFLYSRAMGVWTCFGSCGTTGKTVHFHHKYMQKLYGQQVSLVQAMMNLQSTFAHILPPLELYTKEKNQEALADELEKAVAGLNQEKRLVPKDTHPNDIILSWFMKDNTQ